MVSEATASRRGLLSGVIAGIAGLATGAAGAAAIMGVKKTPQVVVDGRARFKNKVILITGATSGIGAVATKMFATEGGKVAFCGRREDRGAQVESDIRAQGGEAKYIRADVRIEDDVRRTAIRRYCGRTLWRPRHLLQQRGDHHRAAAARIYRSGVGRRGQHRPARKLFCT